jgi:imidazolonepropionase-like amidohydrolase
MQSAQSRRSLTFTLAIVTWAATSFGEAARSQAPGLASDHLALVGGTIYVSPDAEPIRDGVVLIAEGKITAVGNKATVKVPRNARSINCSGLTITAGFWNSHVHFFQRKWAKAAEIPAPELNLQIQQMLTRYGFTSVFDLGSQWENTRIIRDRIESGEVPGPRIRSTGDGLFPPGLLPPEQVFAVLGLIRNPNPDPGVADAVQAAAAAKKLLDAGVDGIKLHSLSDESVMRAAVEEAHRSGKPVFAHTRGGGANLLAAVRAGVDVVAHTTPVSQPWDEATIALMKERRVAVIPTLQIWKYLRRHDRISALEQWVTASREQLRSWNAAGGIVLFGTDVGAVDYDPAEEYTLLTAAGMSFRQILAALTTAPAERFGDQEKLGRVAEGFRADLVVLRADPSKDIRALADVQYTIRRGKIIYRAG